jgi:hypothetical protein
MAAFGTGGIAKGLWWWWLGWRWWEVVEQVRRLRLWGILPHHGHDVTRRVVLERAQQLRGWSLVSRSTTPQHSFTKTGSCLCLRGIVACLLRLTCLFNRDRESLRTGCLLAGAAPAETPVVGWTRGAVADGGLAVCARGSFGEQQSRAWWGEMRRCQRAVDERASRVSDARAKGGSR